MSEKKKFKVSVSREQFDKIAKTTERLIQLTEEKNRLLHELLRCCAVHMLFPEDEAETPKPLRMEWNTDSSSVYRNKRGKLKIIRGDIVKGTIREFDMYEVPECLWSDSQCRYHKRMLAEKKKLANSVS